MKTPENCIEMEAFCRNIEDILSTYIKYPYFILHIRNTWIYFNLKIQTKKKLKLTQTEECARNLCFSAQYKIIVVKSLDN